MFEVIEETWDAIADEGSNGGVSYELLVEALVGTCLKYAVTATGAKMALSVFVGRCGDIGVGQLLDTLVKIAEDQHRAHCTCCYRAHAVKEAA